METKKKLRKDIEALNKAVADLRKETNDQWKLIDRLVAKKKAQEDIISGGEAAKLLGWQSGYVSSTWLDKVGIKYSKGDNGCLKISHKAVEEYLESRKTTTED